MEILDRYLQAVRRHLPWHRQDDIIAELRANLEAQLEDKEAELGRRLSEAEIESWLKDFGPPIVVAGRYKPQQYLIGPGLFPFYWNVLRLSLSWCTAVYIVVRVIDLVANGRDAFAVAAAIVQLPWILFLNAAIVTVVFAVIERAGKRIPEKYATVLCASDAWSRGMEAPFEGALRDAKKRPSYAKAVAEVVFGYPFLLWLLLVPHYPYLLFGPGKEYFAGLPYKLAPVWWFFYWFVVGTNVIELAIKTFRLLRGTWQERNPAQHIAMRSLSLIPLGVLLAAPQFFLLKNPLTDVPAHRTAIYIANKGLHTAIAIVCAVVVLQLIWESGKTILQAYRKRVAAAH